VIGHILGYGLWVMGYGLWVMGYGLWVMGYGYGLWVMGYELWVRVYGFMGGWVECTVKGLPTSDFGLRTSDLLHQFFQFTDFIA